MLQTVRVDTINYLLGEAFTSNVGVERLKKTHLPTTTSNSFIKNNFLLNLLVREKHKNPLKIKL